MNICFLIFTSLNSFNPYKFRAVKMVFDRAPKPTLEEGHVGNSIEADLETGTMEERYKDDLPGKLNDRLY